MTDTKPKSVCLICLKRFGGAAVHNGGNNDGVVTPPKSSMSILESYLRMKENDSTASSSVVSVDSRNQSGSPSDLYSKFLHLTGRYLQVSASEAFLTLAKEHEGNTGMSVDVFCQHCQVFVGSICDLYGELQVIKLKLLGKVEELESVTRQSVKLVSTKLVRVLFKTLAEQLNVKAVSRLELFRKNIILSCRRKVKASPPQVLVPRGLLPDQWTFTYSAAKLVLMRLIIIFALAVAPPRSQKKISEETTGRTIGLGNDDNAHQFKEMRSNRRRRAACSENKTLEGIQEEDDHFNTDDSGNVPVVGGGDENDSDWSAGAAPLGDSPDSPESDASYTPQHDEKVTFPQPKPPKKSRTQRLAFGLVQVICEEDGDVATDNPHFQQMIENQLKQTPSINPDDPSPVCKLCKNAYPATWSLVQHLKTVHSIVNAYHCSTCALEFKTANEVITHRRKMHLEVNKKFTCPKCPHRTFACNRARNQHLKKIHRMAPTSLPISLDRNLWGLKFKAANALSGHQKRRVHRENVHCPECPRRTFATSSALALHMRRIHKAPLEHSCHLCDYKTNSSSALATHKSNAHVRKRQPPRKKSLCETDKFANVPCQVCQATFESGPVLRRHLNEEHEQQVREQEKTVPCTICFMKFAYQQTMELHVVACHLRRYKFVCDAAECTEYFSNHLQLNKHVEKVHLLDSECQLEPEHVGQKITRVKSLSYCKTCNCAFVSADMLKLHELTHVSRDKDKMYACPDCEHKELVLLHLVAHFNSLHGKQWQIFKCLECPAKFTSVHGHRRHAKGHHNRTAAKYTRLVEQEATLKEEKSKEANGKDEEEIIKSVFSCPHCPQRRFINAATLASHRSTAHHICSLCDYKAQDGQQLKLHRENLHMVKKTMKKDKEKNSGTLATGQRTRKVDRTKIRAQTQAHYKLPESLKQRLEAVDSTDIEMYSGVPCQVCNSAFESGPSLRAHLNVEHEQVPDAEKAISCTICCTKFAFQQTHELHYLVQHVEAYKFVCDAESCHAHFLNRDDLNAHLEAVHLENPGNDQGGTQTVYSVKVKSISYCKTCNWGFANPYFLQLHQLTHDIRRKNNRYACPECKVTKSTILTVVAHYNVAHGNKLKIFKCLECPIKFAWIESLQNHVKRRKASGGKQVTENLEKSESGFVCSECGQGYKYVSKFRFHKLQHNPSAGYFGCAEEGCEKAFTTKAQLITHMEWAHDNNNFVCQEVGCGQEFKNRRSLWWHEKEHHPGKHVNKVVCTEPGCGRTFKTRWRMQDHRIIHGEREKCSLCPICGTSFLSEHARRHHERWVHVPPQFECDICHKKYKRKGALQRHQIIHNPEKYTVMCQECGMTFTGEEGLRHHRNSKHTPHEQKKFACSHCQYRTHRPGLLRSHLRTCLKNLGLPWDEEKYGKLPAAWLSKFTGPPRKPGRKPGWNKRKRDDDEEEMEDKPTTENENSEEEEVQDNKTDTEALMGASCNEQKEENAPTTSQVDNNQQQQQHENKEYSQPALAMSQIIYYPDM